MRVPALIGSAMVVAFLQSPNSANAEEEPVLSLSTDSSFHFEVLVSLSEALYGGSDLAPVLGAAKNITPGDFESFSQAFQKLAYKTKDQALDEEANYDPMNVRETWFSAATYFRRADFYLHNNWTNPLINTLWDEQTNAFDKGLSSLPVPGQRLQIPADNFTVEAIWYEPMSHQSKNQTSQRPTLILGNGYDGAQEDLYHTVVVPALSRGWNCLTYEGPGHPTVRRKQNLGFIPDWERVVTPLVDYLLKDRSNAVDKDKLALFGFSFGGYLAARAAAFEPRISAVVLDGGVWDCYEAFSPNLSPELKELFDSGNKEAFDEAGRGLLDDPLVPSQARWGLAQGMWAFNTQSPYDFMQATKKYAVKDFITQIKVPVFVVDAESEGFFSGQPQRVKDALGDLATLHTFTGAEGYHCQAGAFSSLNRVMFGWLNKVLPK